MELKNFLLSTLYCLLFTSAYGFSNFSGRGEGFCRSYSVLATGFDAVGWNPACLAVSPQFSFNIATLGVEYNSNLTFADYMKLYERDYFDERDKEMFKDGEQLSVSGMAQAFSFSFKNMGLVTYAYSTNDMKIPKDVADLIFWGNEVNRTYLLEGVEGELHSGFAVALSVAKLVRREERLLLDEGGNFAFGGTIKYLHGLSYMGIEESSGSLGTTMEKIAGNGELVYCEAEGGYGVGVDFGVLYLINNWTLGVSVINAFSEMIWTTGTSRVSTSFVLDSTDLEHFNPDTTLRWEEKEEEGLQFKTRLSPIARLGGALKRERLLVVGEVGYPPFFSVGLEFPYTVTKLRCGVGVVDGRGWFGFGIGVGPIPLNLDAGIRISSASHISGALTLSVLPRE